MALRVAMILLSLAAASMSAQPITIDFENIPIGTPAEAIDIPGVRFGANSGFTVQDLATYAKDLPPGVTLTKASGRALILRKHQGEKLAWGLDVVVDSPFVSISSVIGGYGCWGIDARTNASYAIGWTNQPCGIWPLYFIPSQFDYYYIPYERDVTFTNRGPLGYFSSDYANGWDNLGGAGFQLYTPGQYGPVGPDAATYFIGNITITPYTGSDTCHLPTPLHLLPPYEYTRTTQNPPPPVKAGDLVHVTWSPVTFQPGSTNHQISIRRYFDTVRFFDPVTCADPTHGYYCDFPDETATSSDWILPRTQGGDRVDDYWLNVSQQCGSEQITVTTHLVVRVTDPPEPLHIDTISPSVAPPGSALTILGSGFVGTPALAETTTVAPAAKALDFVPPGNITVKVGGVFAKVTVIDNRTLKVIVPQLLNGAAGIVIHTVYDEESLPAGNFTVGSIPPRRRAASH
jgi:hypothetical protein